MSLNSIFQFLVPKDNKFFPLFEQATTNLVQLASHLHEAVNLPLKEREALFQKIDELEQRGEEITRETNLELSRNFITPFDREDIHSLITSIDNVADNLQGAASRMRLYHVDKITKSIRKMTEINLEACLKIESAVKDLNNLNNVKNITSACSKINKLEEFSKQQDYIRRCAQLLQIEEAGLISLVNKKIRDKVVKNDFNLSRID